MISVFYIVHTPLFVLFFGQGNEEHRLTWDVVRHDNSTTAQLPDQSITIRLVRFSLSSVLHHIPRFEHTVSLAKDDIYVW